MPYIGNDIQYGELASQTFTGNGGTSFTLNYSVSNVNSLLVTVADVIQEPTVAYTLSGGTSLNFTSAPTIGDTIHVRYLGRTLDIPQTSILQDTDQDTKVQVEKSADEDTIRFDAAGTEVASATTTAFNINNLVNTAASGIIESNANIVDTCLVGPAVDGKTWDGKFENGSVWSSLMLATVETSGADAELNLWDLTNNNLASATPLATVTLTGATPTSIASSMGYIIVGTSDQGFHIVDPHDGSWTERTKGWPRSINATTPAPAVNNLNISHVAAGLSAGSGLDPRTGGQMPNFAIGYAAGDAAAGLVKHDGNIYDESAYTSTAAGSPVAISNGIIFLWRDDIERVEGSMIDKITGAWSPNGAHYETNLFPTVTTVHDYDATPDGVLVAFEEGLYQSFGLGSGVNPGSQRASSMQWFVNGTYTTGLVPNEQKLVALANSKTADRSGNSNTLTENGTVTEAAVETGAELNGYSGFSAANYLDRASDADWNAIGTGAATIIAWFKSSGNSATEYLFGFGDAGATLQFNLTLQSDGTVAFTDDGATANVGLNPSGTYDDGNWHQLVGVRRSSTDRDFFIDGVLVQTSTTDAGSLTGTVPLAVGRRPGVNDLPATTSTISLVRLSATAISADQVHRMYEAEKGMFAANAKCLLQGVSDAVLDARVDPLTGKVIVTQANTQDIFDGLVIETERTIASGGTNFEHGLLWGDGVVEVNDANVFASMPATDQRQVNEMVRSMAAELPAGVDLSKAKAWVVLNASGSIKASFNVESVTYTATGINDIAFAIPFKNANYVYYGGCEDGSYVSFDSNNLTRFSCRASVRTDAAAASNQPLSVAFFGELENE